MTAAKPKTVKAYKAFNPDWTCLGFQYEVGKTYKMEGDVELCERGFHACENPLDTWGYYDIVNSDGEFARFADVTLSGQIKKGKKSENDTKIAAATITIEAEITLPEFVKRAVSAIIATTKGKKKTSGHYAKIGSSGQSAQIGSSGQSAQIGSSGDYAKIGSSGQSAQIGSSGDYAKIGSSGDYAKIGSSGQSAQIGSSGDYAQIRTSGEKAVVAAAGPQTQARGVKGARISIAEYNEDECIGFATGCIGKKGLKPNTWYEAKGGKLVEVKL